MTNFYKLGNRDAEFENMKATGPAPEPKAPRYTVAKSGPMRAARLLKDGATWFDATASAGVDMPGGIMGALQRIADLLNQHGEG
jgi:hypothetical protein